MVRREVILSSKKMCLKPLKFEAITSKQFKIECFFEDKISFVVITSRINSEQKFIQIHNKYYPSNPLNTVDQANLLIHTYEQK